MDFALNWPRSGRTRLLFFSFFFSFLRRRLCFPTSFGSWGLCSFRLVYQGLAGVLTFWRWSNVSVYITSANALPETLKQARGVGGQMAPADRKVRDTSPISHFFFFFLPLARRHPAKLWSRCDAGGRLVQTGSYTQKILFCFFQIRNFFSLPEMFWSLCTAEGQRALSASPPPPAAKVYSSQM